MRYRKSIGGILLQWVFTLGSLAVALIPFWIWFACYKLLEPVDFWQRVVVFGFGAYFLGGLQIFLIIAWISFLFVIWED